MELYMRTVVCISLCGNGKTGVKSTALYRHPLTLAPHVLLWILFFVPGDKGLTISLNSNRLIMRTTDTCFLPNQLILTKSNLPKGDTSLSTVFELYAVINLSVLKVKKKKRNIQFAPCKGIRILESGEVLLVESAEIREKFACGIWKAAHKKIRNPTSDWNPESKFR